jgi:hypothetical protein
MLFAFARIPLRRLPAERRPGDARASSGFPAQCVHRIQFSKSWSQSGKECQGFGLGSSRRRVVLIAQALSKPLVRLLYFRPAPFYRGSADRPGKLSTNRLRGPFIPPFFRCRKLGGRPFEPIQLFQARGYPLLSRVGRRRRFSREPQVSASFAALTSPA